jgi:hypothetical protein
MTRVRRLKTYLDPIDLFFGIFPAAASYAAFVTWASLIVRAIRGEDVKEDRLASVRLYGRRYVCLYTHLGDACP